MTRILLVESDAGARLLLEGLLSRAGYEVTVAESGAQGLARARERGFDLVLVAAQLSPGPDGIEVCRRLQPTVGGQGVSIVLTSQRAPTREEQEQGYEAGCAAYIPRSDTGLLESIVHALARLKSARDEIQIHSQGLEDQVRRLREELQRTGHAEEGLRGGRAGSHARQISSPRPDGLLIVDDEGVVRFADRGALSILGSEIEGHNLGSLAPASGLEAYVRDTRTEPREGFHLDLQARAGRIAHSLTVSVVPLIPPRATGGGLQRAVMLQDALHRRLAQEALRLHDSELSRRMETTALDLCRKVLGPAALLGTSQAIAQVRAAAARAARAEEPVLIQGPSGSGKSLCALIVHYSGDRGGRALVFDCGASSPESCAAELLGQVRGAQPGIPADRPGVLHAAHQGTLILEDVEDLSAEAQQAILTVITEGVVLRRGALRAEPLEVRVLATSAADLQDAANQGRFLPELLQLLRGRSIALPPLRERTEDLAVLIQGFLARWSRAPEQQLSPAVQAAIDSYAWPGNVRELEGAIERGCQLAVDGPIEVHHLPQALRAHAERVRALQLVPSRRRERLDRPQQLHPAALGALGAHAVGDHPISFEHYEKLALVKALQAVGGDKMAAARKLGIGKSTLYRKLQRHGLV